MRTRGVLLALLVLLAAVLDAAALGVTSTSENSKKGSKQQQEDIDEEEGFVHETLRRASDPEGEYEQADEVDLSVLSEDEATSSKKNEHDLGMELLAAEVRERCFSPAGDRVRANSKFCRKNKGLLNQAKKKLRAATAATVALLVSEATGVLTNKDRAAMKALRDRLAAHKPSDQDRAKNRRHSEAVVRGLRNSKAHKSAHSSSPPPPLALADLGERVRRHLSSAGIENPVEASSSKMWPNPVPYAFWNPPRDVPMGLMRGVLTNCPWSEVQSHFAETGDVVAVSDDEKVFPFYDDTVMLKPEKVSSTVLKVTPSIVRAFRAVVAHVEKNTCLRFKEVKADSDEDKILVVRRGTGDHGAVSNGIGRTVDRYVLPHGGRHGLHVIEIGKETVQLGTIVHEVLHALGLGHTQQRADSKTYVKHFPDNMKEVWRKQYTPDDMPASWFVSPLDKQAFDFGSVMSYPAWSSQMADAAVLADADAYDKNLEGEIRMLESLVPADPKRRALNEMADMGGLGQCTADNQGRMSFVDAEIVNSMYSCKQKMRKRPANKEIVGKVTANAQALQELETAVALCSCPTAKYAGRVERKEDCLREPSQWGNQIAEVVRSTMPELKGLALAAHPLQKAKKARGKKKKAALEDELKERERNSVVRYLGQALTTFVGGCRKYCATRPEYLAARCWVNANKFDGPLTVSKTDKGVPSVPWSFACDYAGDDEELKPYGCYFA